jgi:uncharacterized protein YfdQ (DUF2303 family)
MNAIDKPMLEKLIKDSVATQAQDLIDNHTTAHVALVPEGFEIVSLDKYRDHPSRKRGLFATSSLIDFHNYIQREVEHMLANNDDIAPAVFISEEKLTARAILDYGLNDRPGHCDHVAKFALKLNEEFKLIRDANKKWLSQLEFVNFLDDLTAYIHHLSDSDGEEIELKKGFQALRKIKFSATAETEIEESDYAKRQTGLAAISVKTGHETNLPARVVFALYPSPDLDLMEIEARLRIRQDGSNVMISLDIILLEKTLQCMMQAFRDKVIEQLDGLGVDVYVGEYQVS